MSVPPIDILAVLAYYKQGNVDIKVALLLCVGFFVGGWFGAKIGTALPSDVLSKVFAILLILSAVKVLFTSSTEAI